ncbi:MAG: TetR/AcrR family transcriptional regulator [Lachnospiraceae bacterium]|nr:TetR/AcrR family transcriptional regulator [Lachnospiraceae bacterium]
MDLRTERTRKNIINAFIELRVEKPIEKITVKELSDHAYINKATFYRHYEDIYALAESIENELIQNCLDMLTEPIRLFEKDGVRLLVETLSSQGELFDIIFSGSRKDMAIHKIHDCLLEKIYIQHPEYRDDLEKKVMLSTLIYGMFQSYRMYKDVDYDIVISSLVKLNSALR